MDTRPRRQGVYQTRLRDNAGGYFEQKYSFWDGKRWSDSASNISSALAKKKYPGFQEKKWRGLASKP